MEQTNLEHLDYQRLIKDKKRRSLGHTNDKGINREGDNTIRLLEF